ncbi:MAG TPA: expansin EXLX1 family cellulose-binding protein, partial [Kribbellaceae bacterium]
MGGYARENEGGAAGQPGPRRGHRGGRWLGASLAAVALVSTAAVVVAVLRTGDAACAASPPGVRVASLRGVPAPGVGHSGTATHYTLRSGGGNCSYPGPPADGLYVALSPAEYAQAGACGGYLDVAGPAGSVRIKIVDQCPECATGHIDLSTPAFARIAALADGMVKVTYRLVRNPRVPGELTYRVKEGSSRYWLAILPDNHGNPVSRLEVRSPGGSWHRLSHADYNYWLADHGAGPGPFAVRLTDIAGNQVVTGSVGLRPGVTQRSGQRAYSGAAPLPRGAAA